MWKAVKMTKVKSYEKQKCFGGVLEDKDIKSQVSSVEQMLEMESSELRFENMTVENFETAANMFIYLITCPYVTDVDLFKSWELYYKDLFNEKTPPDQILLALNRMMKVKNENGGKLRASKLFKRIADYLSLNYPTIQRLLSLQAENVINPNISKSIKSEGTF